jgi:hypothetical protein
MNAVPKYEILTGIALVLAGSGVAFAVEASAIGTPLTLTITVGSEPYYPIDSAVGADNSGNFSVLWKPNSSDVGNLPPQLMKLRRFTPDGTPLTGEVEIQNTLIDIAGGHLGVDAVGDSVVAWRCGQQGQGTTPTLCAQVFNPDGSAKTSQVTVFSGVPVSGTSPQSAISSVAVAVAATGDFVVAWSSYTNYAANAGGGFLGWSTTESVQTRRYHVDGTPYGDAQTIVQHHYRFAWTTFIEDVLLSMVPSGNYVAGWQSQSGPHIQYFSADGSAAQANPVALKLGNAKGSTASLRAIALAPSGDLVTVIGTRTSNDLTEALSLQHYGNHGRKLESSTSIATLASDAGAVSLNVDSADNAVVTWGDSGTATNYARAFGPDGTALDDVFVVSTDSAITAGENLSATLDPNGNLLAVWGNVFAQLFQGP